MSLFSDVDWTILLLAGALLLLGDRGKDVFRLMGRYYAKFLRIRDELTRDLRAELLQEEQKRTPTPFSEPVVPRPTTSAPAVSAAPVGAPPLAGGVATAAGPEQESMREVHTGSGFPPDQGEMYR